LPANAARFWWISKKDEKNSIQQSGIAKWSVPTFTKKGKIRLHPLSKTNPQIGLFMIKKMVRRYCKCKNPHLYVLEALSVKKNNTPWLNLEEPTRLSSTPQINVSVHLSVCPSVCPEYQKM
jgi:hypothetical protein